MNNNNITYWNVTDIPAEEVISRRKKVLEIISKDACKAMIFFSAGSLQYLTGASLIPTERPMVFILKEDGSTALLVPRLELEHAQSLAKAVDCIECYPEYPGEKHPMDYLTDMLKKMNLDNGNIAAESDGYGSYWGYRGPKISTLCSNMKLKLYPRLVEELKIIKSSYDQKVIKESARWANLAHALLQEYTKPGCREIDVEKRVEKEATQIMLKTLGPSFVQGGRISARAGYRGQIGKNSYYPHAVAKNLMFKPGDTLVTGAVAGILGYDSELERVFFVGEPNDIQIKFYNHAIQLQDIALNAIKPGKKCSDVDKEVKKYYNDNNLMPYWRHHTGHALGFAGHELPFLDSNDDTVIQPGMVFSVEPGLYVEDVGGFRLSDTALVTETGIEMITYYQKNIDDIICNIY